MTKEFFRQLMLSIFTEEDDVLVGRIITTLKKFEKYKNQNGRMTLKIEDYKIVVNTKDKETIIIEIVSNEGYNLKMEMFYSDDTVKKTFFNKKNIITKMRSN